MGEDLDNLSAARRGLLDEHEEAEVRAVMETRGEGDT